MIPLEKMTSREAKCIALVSIASIFFYIYAPSYSLGVISGIVLTIVAEIVCALYIWNLVKKPSGKKTKNSEDEEKNSELLRNELVSSDSNKVIVWIAPRINKIPNEGKKVTSKKDLISDEVSYSSEDMIRLDKCIVSLKGRTLLLVGDKINMDINLEECDVKAISANGSEERKWNRRFPIRISHPRKCLFENSKNVFVYFKSGYEKEKWCISFQEVSIPTSVLTQSKLLNIKSEFMEYVKHIKENYSCRFDGVDEIKEEDPSLQSSEKKPSSLESEGRSQGYIARGLERFRRGEKESKEGRSHRVDGRFWKSKEGSAKGHSKYSSWLYRRRIDAGGEGIDDEEGGSTEREKEGKIFSKLSSLYLSGDGIEAKRDTFSFRSGISERGLAFKKRSKWRKGSYDDVASISESNSEEEKEEKSAVSLRSMSVDDINLKQYSEGKSNADDVESGDEAESVFSGSALGLNQLPALKINDIDENIIIDDDEKKNKSEIGTLKESKINGGVKDTKQEKIQDAGVNTMEGGIMNFDYGVNWVNCFITRIFFDLCRNEFFLQMMKDRVQKKLSGIKRPSYVDPIVVTHFDVGKLPFLAKSMNIHKISEDGEISLDLDVEYHGDANLVVETRLNMQLQREEEGKTKEQLSSQRKEENSVGKEKLSLFYRGIKAIYEHVNHVTLSLAFTICSISGKCRVRIGAPPVNRLWVGFLEMPTLDIKSQPSIGDLKIKKNFVSHWMEEKIKTIIKENFVFPQSSDILLKFMSSYPDNFLAGQGDFMPMNVQDVAAEGAQESLHSQEKNQDLSINVKNSTESVHGGNSANSIAMYTSDKDSSNSLHTNSLNRIHGKRLSYDDEEYDDQDVLEKSKGDSCVSLDDGKIGVEVSSSEKRNAENLNDVLKDSANNSVHNWMENAVASIKKVNEDKCNKDSENDGAIDFKTEVKNSVHSKSELESDSNSNLNSSGNHQVHTVILPSLPKIQYSQGEKNSNSSAKQTKQILFIEDGKVDDVNDLGRTDIDSDVLPPKISGLAYDQAGTTRVKDGDMSENGIHEMDDSVQINRSSPIYNSSPPTNLVDDLSDSFSNSNGKAFSPTHNFPEDLVDIWHEEKLLEFEKSHSGPLLPTQNPIPDAEEIENGVFFEKNQLEREKSFSGPLFPTVDQNFDVPKNENNLSVHANNLKEMFSGKFKFPISKFSPKREQEKELSDRGGVGMEGDGQSEGAGTIHQNANLQRGSRAWNRTKEDSDINRKDAKKETHHELSVPHSSVMKQIGHRMFEKIKDKALFEDKKHSAFSLFHRTKDEKESDSTEDAHERKGFRERWHIRHS